MSTIQRSFKDLFEMDFLLDEQPIRLNRIEIPIIQRDYAQGRMDPEIQRVRMRFLGSLYHAILGDPITLDFVYGDLDEEGVMTPLDGQQRLTTLFLLHWYAAKKEQVDSSKFRFLKNFSYETRYSARDFCAYLIDFEPTFQGSLSEELIDQAWFPLDWRNDPTIRSMLVVLDAISEIFAETDGIWEPLMKGAITFHFLPIKDMGLTDELYIKMNSRGKPLTRFEHFKAELEHELLKIDEPTAQRILKKIDIDWTDLLWQYRGEDNLIDDEFLRYFRFVCDILTYRRGGSTQGQSTDEFDLLQEFFSSKEEDALSNIGTMEAAFDVWCELNRQGSLDEFFGGILSFEHQVDKVRADSRYDLNIFRDCLYYYADVMGEGARQFPLGRVVLLYAFWVYLLHRETITSSEFIRRLRVVNNLIQNSQYEISDSETRTGGNRMPAILKQTDSIILDGVIDERITNGFNVHQLAEEALKIEWLKAHPDLAEGLYELEDHDLLFGQIGIVGLEHPEYFGRFSSLFECNWDLVDRALMSIGYYGQRERNGWRFNLGSWGNPTAWKNLFHRSANTGFEGTKGILLELLSRVEAFSDEYLEGIIEGFLKESETSKLFEWRYYYVGYEAFRPGRFGKYLWNWLCNFDEKPYEIWVMWTDKIPRVSSYQPFLKAVDPRNLKQIRIYLGNRYIVCMNDSYVMLDAETNLEVKRIPIMQNEQGIDMEDRIQKYLRLRSEGFFED